MTLPETMDITLLKQGILEWAHIANELGYSEAEFISMVDTDDDFRYFLYEKADIIHRTLEGDGDFIFLDSRNENDDLA